LDNLERFKYALSKQRYRDEKLNPIIIHREAELNQEWKNKEDHPELKETHLKDVSVFKVSVINDSSDSAAIFNLPGELFGVIRDESAEMVIIYQGDLLALFNTDFSNVEQAEVLVENHSFVWSIATIFIDFLNETLDLIKFTL
jgi:hypothetical protein